MAMNGFSKDRNRSGGGIGFFIRDTINYRLRFDLNDADIEILTIEIRKNKVKPFLIPTWYRPPNDPMDTLYKFEHCLKLIDLENKVINRINRSRVLSWGMLILIF